MDVKRASWQQLKKDIDLVRRAPVECLFAIASAFAGIDEDEYTVLYCLFELHVRKRPVRVLALVRLEPDLLRSGVVKLRARLERCK